MICLYFIFNPEYSFKPHYGIICGLIGALAYLTKSYAFTFFIAHFILFNIFHYLKEMKNKKIIIKNLILGLIIFFVISGSWSAIISFKYDKITFGTSGKYNHDLVGPIQVNYGIPIWNGFMEPSTKNAISAWEDPSYHKLKSWSSFESYESFKYQISIIKDNIFKTIEFYKEFSYFSLIILIFYILMLIRPFKDLISNSHEILFPLITILLYTAGYLFIVINSRYLIMGYILLILMGGYILNLIFNNNKKFTQIKKYLLLTFFIISIITVQLTSLEAALGDEKNTRILITDLSHYNIKGNIASNNNYETSLKLCYFMNSQYYGTSQKNWNPISDEELEKNLKIYNIDYYFVWGNSTNEDLLSKYKEVSGGKIQGLRIYSIKNQVQSTDFTYKS